MLVAAPVRLHAVCFAGLILIVSAFGYLRMEHLWIEWLASSESQDSEVLAHSKSFHITVSCVNVSLALVVMILGGVYALKDCGSADRGVERE